jgi:glutamate/tyrosine decarboxylase-like PLP-dependent enzyme
MPHRDPAHDEPYETALPWSRRAAGIPLFVALATLGAPALATKIEQIFQLGTALRARLHDVGFTRVNDTPLPLVCFTHPSFDTGARTPGDVARALRHDGRVWLTPTTLSSGRTVLRAALTSLDTDDTDLDALVDALRRAIA